MRILGIAHGQLQQRGTYAAHEIICQKTLRAHLVLQCTAEHPQRKHIEEEVRHTPVQEHVRHHLITVKQRALDIEQRQPSDQLVTERKQRCGQQHHAVGDNQILYYRRGRISKPVHRLWSFFV